MANKNTRFKNSERKPAKPNQDGIVSMNRKRNMQMAVYHNKGEDGRTFSMTVHEPMVKGAYVTPKNHGYMDYKQPANAK